MLFVFLQLFHNFVIFYKLSRKTCSISVASKSTSVSQQANSESALGKYAGGVAGAAGDAALFVANHAY